MNIVKSVRPFYLYICISSICFGLLNYFQIQYQFYLWEIFVDIKIMSLLLFLLYIGRKGESSLAENIAELKNWNVKKMFQWFGLPLGFYGIVIIAGIILSEIKFQKPDNATTLILATIFDMPAVFIFSLFYIFLEEFIFRSFVVRSLMSTNGKTRAIFLSSFFWTLFAIPDFVSFAANSFYSFTAVVLYLFVIGILGAVVYLIYKTVWFSYSFRIGTITLAPLCISSLIVESDPFFLTTSVLFSAEGIIISVLFSAFSVFFATKYLGNQNDRKTPFSIP